MRAYYSGELAEFRQTNTRSIIGTLTALSGLYVKQKQKDAWRTEIDILKEIPDLDSMRIFLEFPIPRMGKRADMVLIYNGIVFVIEFKVGSSKYRKKDVKQCMNYALCMKKFHEGSRNMLIVPILVATDADAYDKDYVMDQKDIINPVRVGKQGLGHAIAKIAGKYGRYQFDADEWENSKDVATIIIDGKEIAQSLKNRIDVQVTELKRQGISPCLATVLVGDDPASATYVRNKHKACMDVGINTKDYKLDASATQSALHDTIDSLNSDDSVHGILVQLPLPPHLDEFEAISRISPEKDVDGLTPHNAGLLAMGKADLVACTPSGVMEMFRYHGIELEGKNVVLINRSNLVGRPLYRLLLGSNATVTTCHSRTAGLYRICRGADIIITAVGNRDRFVLTPAMVRDGAVVIDVAISRFEGRLVGDADYEGIIKKASFATPVPGGVGPMTVVMLLKNTVTAASRRLLD